MRVCVLDVWSTGQSPRKFPSHSIWSESPPSLYLCVCVCVLLPFRLCASATYIIEKKIQQLSFSSNSMLLFFNMFFPSGFWYCAYVCLSSLCVCVFPCILLHCLERKCTRTSSPPYSTYIDTRDRIKSAIVWASYSMQIQQRWKHGWWECAISSLNLAELGPAWPTETGARV